MRHRKAGTKLNMSSSHRQAMFRNMVTSLLKHDKIRTTDTRAKELRRWADHIITLAKQGDLHARRQVLAIVREKDVVHKLFEEAEKRFGKLNGGYTRVTKIGRRPGDAALVSVIELISSEDTPKKKKKKTKTKKEAPAAKTAGKVTKAKEATPAEEPNESQQADADADAKEAVSDEPIEAEAQADETLQAQDSAAEEIEAAEDEPADVDAAEGEETEKKDD